MSDLPKKIVVWASIGTGTREETLEVPDWITTVKELESWASETAAELAESGWYPVTPATVT